MPLSLRRGTVTAIDERHESLLRLSVDGTSCIAYPSLTGGVEEGDVVLVNTQARDLELGSGGFDVVYANLTRGLGLEATAGAHVVALPYTPGQHSRRFAEQELELADDLGGVPVVCCGLHGQLAPVCAALAGLRVVYVQLGGGALPVSLSDAVRALKARGLLDLAVSVSPCLDGDMQCVTTASGLLAARARDAQVIVVSIGPGIVGTGTRFGHGGVAAADAANAACALGGSAVLAARVSLADARRRHRGLSHHTRAALRLCLGSVRVAWPAGLDPPGGVTVETVDADAWETACSGLPLDHMGRGCNDDPWFFAAAFAAGRLARELVVA
jgi:Protein of unknown function (DUF3866)